ncbi:MAG: response regulator [Candidatus Parcubacteria bacterium]|nr:response regulator [Candidatus Parcubacteria bacterium]
MKILIAEDEESLVKVFREKFEREKFTVEFVMSGDMVLPTAKKFMPDIILLDIILPKKTGLVILKELKAEPDVKHIPVIMISNLDGDEQIKESIKLGAIDYLVKSQHPINELVEKVNNALVHVS